MLASINGQVRNGTKKEIVEWLKDESEKRTTIFAQSNDQMMFHMMSPMMRNM